jgi:glycerol-3-phosphate acyltransferase PlsY
MLETLTPHWPLAAAALIGFLSGSVPFGLILTQMSGGGDIRATGSGNIGATNVLRTGRKGIALATLLLDGAKGAVVVLLSLHFLDLDAALAAGVGAVAGHMFPPWLGFRGGKGVATTFGVLLALDWIAGLAALVTWAAMAALARKSSLAAITAMIVCPVGAWLTLGQTAGLVMGAVAAAVILAHHENIRRLLTGTEPRIGKR